MKMNARLGHRLNSISKDTSPSQVGSGEEKVYTREQFVPPEISMINFFLTRVRLFGKLLSSSEILTLSGFELVQPERDEKTNGPRFPEDEDYDSDDESVLTQRKDVLDEDPEVM